MTIVREQKCWDCDQVLPASEFGKNASRSSGLRDQCRPCKRASDAARYRANRDTVLAKQRAKRAKDLDWRDARVAASRAYRADAGHRERLNRQVAAWKAANPERWGEIQRRAYTTRRARKRNVTVIPFTTLQLTARMSFFGNVCWMCGGAFEHVDHVKPLAKGGPHILANLRPSCGSCNTSKGAYWGGVTAVASLMTRT